MTATVFNYLIHVIVISIDLIYGGILFLIHFNIYINVWQYTISNYLIRVIFISIHLIYGGILYLIT